MNTRGNNEQLMGTTPGLECNFKIDDHRRDCGENVEVDRVERINGNPK